MICSAYEITFKVKRRRIWEKNVFDESYYLISTRKNLETDINAVTEIIKKYWYKKHFGRDEITLISIKFYRDINVSIFESGIVVMDFIGKLPTICDPKLFQTKKI